MNRRLVNAVHRDRTQYQFDLSRTKVDYGVGETVPENEDDVRAFNIVIFVNAFFVLNNFQFCIFFFITITR